ncbi:MAG: ParB/RepB/Spo0J family partition protein [Planctomycetota bacterium]
MPDMLNLAVLDLDPDCQQRPIDADLVEEYIGLKKDGVKFPPIQVVRDGGKFYVWDGFHRVACSKKLKEKSIQAHVIEGSRDDAIWKSYAANRTHGKRRARGVAKKIIIKIVTDRKWAEKSQVAIARHVGVSRTYVDKVIKELRQKEKAASDPKNGEKGATVAPPEDTVLQRAKKTKTKSARGKTYKQKSQAKDTTDDADKRPKDKKGNIIPEALEPEWQKRSLIQVHINEFKALNNAIMQHVDDADGVMDRMNINMFKALGTNYRRMLEGCQPYCLCCYCGGRGTNCKNCRDSGMITKFEYAKIPDELKE